MSIGGSIKHAFHHAAHQVEHGAKEAADKVSHEAKHDAGQVESAADTVADQIKKIASAGDEQVKRLTDLNVELLKKAGEDIEHDLESFEKKAVMELTAEAIEKGIKGAHVVALAIEKAIARLEHKAPTIVDLLNGLSIPINLGPLVLTYANGVSRIDDIAGALGKVSGQDFKLTQTFINDLLHGLGPDTVSVHADVEFFVEVGVDLDDIPFEAFVEIADLVFDAVGVPK